MALLASVAVLLPGSVWAGDEETAPYEMIEKEGKFEIREYPDLKVVSTSAKANDKKSADKRFMKLFRYISGSNDAGEKIAMTTPVFMRDSNDENTMSFVLPAAVAERGAPEPAGEEVELEELPGGKFAVYRFSGLRSGALEQKSLETIREWLSCWGRSSRVTERARSGRASPSRTIRS